MTLLRADPVAPWQALGEDGLPLGRMLVPGVQGGPWSVVLWLRGGWEPVGFYPTRGEALAFLFGPLAADMVAPGIAPPADPFAQADALNAAGARKAALESHLSERMARRDVQPLPTGGLFDEVRRNQKELF